jgi:purine-cytosine permease-like protein
MLPDYVAKATPRPPASRAPWYTNTAPTYAGVFLWIGFYQSIANGTLNRAGLGWSLAALCTAALLCLALYYYAPAMLGMKTGFPLYVIGSSTFGAQGGYLIPGLLMGALQAGWYSVSTDLSTRFILKAAGSNAEAGTGAYVLIAALWAYAMAWIAAKGIRYVGRVALFANLIPLVMLLLVFARTYSGFGNYSPPRQDSWGGFILLVEIVTGFFATAGAAGADFGMENRDARDVRLGGLVGIGLPILYAGGLTLIAMAGAHNANPSLSSYNFDALISVIGGPLSRAIFVLYAIASVPGACFCAFIMGNSFSTMLPNLRRTPVIMAGVSVSIVLASTGVASHLVPFFQIIGASFGPVCGAILADYLLSGKKWAGPRQGINFAGYGAWAAGFLVGIVPFLPGLDEWKAYVAPATVYSTITGFVVYFLLAKIGWQSRPAVAAMERAQ